MNMPTCLWEQGALNLCIAVINDLHPKLLQDRMRPLFGFLTDAYSGSII